MIKHPNPVFQLSTINSQKLLKLYPTIVLHKHFVFENVLVEKRLYLMWWKSQQLLGKPRKTAALLNIALQLCLTWIIEKIRNSRQNETNIRHYNSPIFVSQIAHVQTLLLSFDLCQIFREGKTRPSMQNIYATTRGRYAEN